MTLINRKQTLLGIGLLALYLVYSALAFAAAPTGDIKPDEQDGETLKVSGNSDVTTATVESFSVIHGEYCSQVIARSLFEKGIDTTAELSEAPVSGRPFEILEEMVRTKEQAEQRAKALAERRAVQNAASSQSPRRHTASVAASGTNYGLPAGAKRYSVSELDAIVRKVGTEAGCSATEIQEMIYIYRHESRDNTAIGGSRNRFCGMWQLHYSMADGNPWWDPYWETKRAIRYMRGRSYDDYGKGIHAAYLHKRAKGWY